MNHPFIRVAGNRSRIWPPGPRAQGVTYTAADSHPGFILVSSQFHPLGVSLGYANSSWVHPIGMSLYNHIEALLARFLARSTRALAGLRLLRPMAMTS